MIIKIIKEEIVDVKGNIRIKYLSNDHLFETFKNHRTLNKH